MTGCVNLRNFRIWGSEQPNEIHEDVRGKAKLQTFLSNLTPESYRYVKQFFYNPGIFSP
jgi:hypothetical protein